MLEIQSVSNALRILNLFARDSAELGVTEVAKKLDMDKATVARLMYTLELGEMLRRVDAESKYQLGVKIIELAGVFLQNSDLRKAALPRMHELHDQTEEATDLTIRDGDSSICIERLESRHPVRGNTRIGRPFSLHAGAAAKILFAYAPDAKREELLNKLNMVRHTSTTITDRDAMRQELNKIRTQGFSISHEELLELICGVGAPVRDNTGRVIAALSIWGLFNHFTVERERDFIRMVVDTANKISRDLGYAGNGN